MVTAVIQARMGSKRLPGKVMLPLGRCHVLNHVVKRVSHASRVNDVVVATSNQKQDDIIAQFAQNFGAEVHRGSETDVLGRLFDAAAAQDADIVVRITADCPLVAPAVLDRVIRVVERGTVDYASNVRKRTFPRGLDVEVFTFESFERVHERATDPHHREHVTPYYIENSNCFELKDVESQEVFNETQFQNRGDLRLTLDEANDYEVLCQIYDNVPFDDILPIRDAIIYVDEHDLMKLNGDVEQKDH